ncbi:MAG: hypothetical protein PF447_03765, partial [Spirochaetaceae bacterium]|nr:hypothetical protein [Spirochaetaceae bacterium]
MKKFLVLLCLGLIILPMAAQDNRIEEPSLLEEVYQEFAFRAIQSLGDNQGKLLVDNLSSSGIPLQASVFFQSVVLKELLYSVPDLEVYEINNYYGSFAEMDYRIFGEVYNEDQVIYISLRLINNQNSRLMAIQNFTIPAQARWGSAFIPQVTITPGITMDRSEPNDTIQSATRINFPMEPLSASFNGAEDADYYILNIPNDIDTTYLTVHTTGSTDTVMTVYGPDNSASSFAEDDDGGDDYNSRVSFEALGGQIWWIMVRAYDDAGDYQLVLEQADESSFTDEANDSFQTAFPMNTDESVSGYYSYNDEGDYFALNITEDFDGQLIRIFTDEDIDTELYLYDEDGAQQDEYLLYNDDSDGYAASISFVANSQT